MSPVPTSGTVVVQYLLGSTWTTFTPALSLSAGSVHTTWVPLGSYQYRVKYGESYSTPFTVSWAAPVPSTVTATADSATIPVRGTAGVTVAVSPVPTSGTVVVQYLLGSTWTTFTPALTLTAGSVHTTWVPLGSYQYRAVYGTYLSDAFTITWTTGTS